MHKSMNKSVNHNRSYCKIEKFIKLKYFFVIVKTRTDLLFILLGGDMHAAFETIVESPLATPTGKNLRLHHILGAF